MADVLQHRGPDETKSVGFDGGSMATTRLSIIDTAASLKDVMYTDDHRFIMGYNGEVYNAPELRQHLKGTFKTKTDTEVVLQSYAQRGRQCVHSFNGMFAIAAWDQTKRFFWAARDRFGVKPFFYSTYKGNFYFGSEIKALAAAGVPIEPDEEMWQSYLDTGIYDNAKRTFFKDIFSLPPGWMLTYRNGRVSTIRWYSVQENTINEDTRSDDEVQEEYESLLLDSMKLRLRADVPTGITRSQGLDSNLIYYAAKKLGTELPVFSYDEHANVPSDFIHLAGDAAYYQEMPYGGVPTIMMTGLYGLAHLANMKVLIGGEGADEQWAGYAWYKDSANLKAHRLADLTENKLPRALRFMDRASMQHSIEVREPFLDYRLVELALRQPDSRLIRNGQNKYLLRLIAVHLGVPREIAYATKQTVQSPQTEWLRWPLHEWVESLFPAMKRSGFLDMEMVRSKWAEFRANGAPNSFQQWQWISLALNEQVVKQLRSLSS